MVTCSLHDFLDVELLRVTKAPNTSFLSRAREASDMTVPATHSSVEASQAHHGGSSRDMSEEAAVE